MATDKEVLEAFAKNAAYILRLEAERDKLRTAAQAWVTANDNLIEAHIALKAALKAGDE